MSSVITSLQEIPETLDAAIKSHRGHGERIIDAFLAYQEYLSQLQDPEYSKSMLEKLNRSAVSGSWVEGVRDFDDVLAMLSAIEDWQEVIANLEDKDITCFQGKLPRDYPVRAFAAYATAREIAHQFGQPGLDSIKFKKGYQIAGDIYVCSHVHMPTDIITVQLRRDSSQPGFQIEYAKQWFAGREKTSILHEGDADTIVRCSAKIPSVNATHRYNGHKKPYKPRVPRSE